MWARDQETPRPVARARRLRSAMTFSEQKLWRELRKLDAHIRRQAPIGKYIADFACHPKRLVIEVDGEIHERVADVAVRDLERSAWLESQGYKVLRFTNRRVNEDLFGVVDEIRRHLALPLDGEGLGWGERTEVTTSTQRAPAPTRVRLASALRSPQSPTLSPSRGKGE